MTLIEAFDGETDTDIRAAADDILNKLDPAKPNWWHPFELRGEHVYQGKTYREFWCRAGSVQIWLWKLAFENHSRKVIWLSDGKTIEPTR